MNILNQILVAGAVIAASSASVYAAKSLTVGQVNKMFSPGEISVKVGDEVEFANNDKVTHNVMSRTKSHAFNLGSQKPGTQAVHVFTKPGDLEVRCGIHPRMKMKIAVTE